MEAEAANKGPHYITITACWNCGASFEFELREIQQERLEIYDEIRPTEDKSQRCHVRCPHCGRHNTVMI